MMLRLSNYLKYVQFTDPNELMLPPYYFHFGNNILISCLAIVATIKIQAFKITIGTDRCKKNNKILMKFS